MDAEKMTDCAELWVQSNPVAWGKMVKIAKKFARKKRHFSMKFLAEEARYYMRVHGIDQFKINNSLTAPLARKLIKDNPELSEFIETRKSKVDGKDAQ